jgi:hypothetical protein
VVPNVVAVAAVAALQTSQGVDLLVIAGNDFWGAVLLLLSIAGFAATSWYFSRAALDAAAQAANKRVEPELGVGECGAPDRASGIRYWRHIFWLALPFLPALMLAWQESRDESSITSWEGALWVLGFLLLLGFALFALALRPPARTENPTSFPGLEAWLPRVVGALVPYFAGLGFARDAVYIATEDQWLWSLVLALCCFGIAGLLPWLTWWRRSRVNEKNWI